MDMWCLVGLGEVGLTGVNILPQSKQSTWINSLSINGFCARWAWVLAPIVSIECLVFFVKKTDHQRGWDGNINVPVPVSPNNWYFKIPKPVFWLWSFSNPMWLFEYKINQVMNKAMSQVMLVPHRNRKCVTKSMAIINILEIVQWCNLGS